MADTLNEQQLAAATYPGPAKNILVVAGAGCGKTKTMVSRVHYLLRDQGIPPERILCLTFTNNAANQMVSRIASASDVNIDGLTACTFHSFCIKLIRKIPKSFGFDSMPTIIDAASQKILLKDSLASAQEHIEIHEHEKSLVPRDSDILQHYSYARNAMRPVRDQFKTHLTDNPKMLALAEATVANYEEQKKNYGYVDFDDLLYRFVEIAEEKPQLAYVISDLFEEILVDEMQDTNPVQYRILSLLGSGNARIFAVGDPAQSIYGFRGADFSSIYDFEKKFPDSVRLKLSVNYRSYQEVLDVANALLDRSTYTYDNHLSAHRGLSGKKVRLCDFNDGMSEATFVAREISGAYEAGGEFKDNFIITRSAYSAREVEGALKRFNIPYEFVGGMSISKTAHVQDLLALLKMAVNKRDKLSSIRYLSLFKGVGPKLAARGYHEIMRANSHDTIAMILEKTVRKDPALCRGAYDAVITAIENQTNPIKSVLINGFDEIIRANYPDRFEYRLNDLNAVGEIFDQYEGDLDTFISDFTLEPDMNKVEDPDEEEDKVTLITSHSAKGLERKRCFVIGATPGTFPSRRSIGKLETEEEERRTMYVAVTRAEDELIITRNLEFSHSFFKNAKTEIDFIDPLIGHFDVARSRQQVNQLAGFNQLQDIF